MVDSYLLDRDRGIEIIRDDPIVEYPVDSQFVSTVEEKALYMYGQPWSS